MTFSGVLGRGRIRTTKLDEAIGSHLYVYVYVHVYVCILMGSETTVRINYT